MKHGTDVYLPVLWGGLVQPRHKDGEEEDWGVSGLMGRRAASACLGADPVERGEPGTQAELLRGHVRILSPLTQNGWGSPSKCVCVLPATAQGQRHHPGLSHTSSFLPPMTVEVNLIKSCSLCQSRTSPDPLSRPDVLGPGFLIKPFHMVRARIWLEVL